MLVSNVLKLMGSKSNGLNFLIMVKYNKLKFIVIIISWLVLKCVSVVLF